MKANKQDGKEYRTLLSGFIELGRYVWKHALILLLAIAVCAAVTGGLFYRDSKLNGKMSLTLNYETAALGLAPNGEKFDMYSLHGKEVMSRVLEMAGITDMSAEELGSCVSVSTKGASGFSLGDNTTYSITTTYSVTLKQSQRLQRERITTESILSLLSRAYSEYFAEKYIDKGVAIEITNLMNDELEYMDQWELVNLHARQLRSYLNWRSEAAPAFISKTTGESFASLRQQMDNLINVQLADTRAYLLEHGLAKNRSNYISKLDYLNDALGRNRDKRKAAYKIRMQVIDQYDGDMISTVLIPTENSNRKFYMSKTETGIDYLAVDANYDAITVSTFQKKIDTNSNILAHMQAKAENTRAETEKANALLQSASDTVEKILLLTQLNVEDYDRSEVNDYLLWYIVPTGPFSMIGGKTFLAMCGGYAVLALLAAYSSMHRRKRG